MSFLEIGDKLINLDNVKAVRFISSLRANDRGTKVFYIDGSHEFIEGDTDITSQLHEMTAPRVTAAPGFYMLHFWFYDEEPTIQKVLQCSRTPIIAWRLGEYGAKPIELNAEDEVIGQKEAAILYPDGCVVDGLDRWEDMNAWAVHTCEKWTAWRKSEAALKVVK